MYKYLFGIREEVPVVSRTVAGSLLYIVHDTIMAEDSLGMEAGFSILHDLLDLSCLTIGVEVGAPAATIAQAISGVSIAEPPLGFLDFLAGRA